MTRDRARSVPEFFNGTQRFLLSFEHPSGEISELNKSAGEARIRCFSGYFRVAISPRKDWRVIWYHVQKFQNVVAKQKRPKMVKSVSASCARKARRLNLLSTQTNKFKTAGRFFYRRHGNWEFWEDSKHGVEGFFVYFGIGHGRSSR